MPSATTPVVLTHDMIGALPETPLGELAGISRRVLWRDVDSEAGVLDVAAGHSLGHHTHRANHHHLWVLSGHARVLDQDLAEGSYVHIPHGVEHDIDATSTDGCRVFYLYLRDAS
jgi:quercetin dioxygenase-like cupin family protein